MSRSQSVRLLKNAVRRDLEWLLNSRRICDFRRRRIEGSQPLSLRLRSARSFLLTMAASGDRNKLVRQVLATINLFEPRLTNVRLVFVETQIGQKGCAPAR